MFQPYSPEDSLIFLSLLFIIFHFKERRFLHRSLSLHNSRWIFLFHSEHGTLTSTVCSHLCDGLSGDSEWHQGTVSAAPCGVWPFRELPHHPMASVVWEVWWACHQKWKVRGSPALFWHQSLVSNAKARRKQTHKDRGTTTQLLSR